MSASPMAREAVSHTPSHMNAAPQSIPRRVTINSPEEMPSDYGTTPGGTIFSTTPGGTRIIYERKFLMQCRASPLSKTPPANLPNIPGITTKDTDAAPPRENGTIPEEPEKTDVDVDDDQFEMDL